ncbi:MAG TPA: M14 family metallopeptidase [Anaerolineales bacterium]|nr:M14 family metallopeptidase [Anaerolineales bacterium]
MKTTRLRFLLTCFLIALAALILLIRSLIPPPATALSGKTDPLDATPPPLNAEIYVVRAYYGDYQMVRDLSTWTEPWEVYSDLGFVVLGVNAADLNLLHILGFRVELDEEATLAMNTPRTADPAASESAYPTIPGFACYRTVEGTFMTAEDLVAGYPDLAAWLDVGNSWQKLQDPPLGYDMQVLVLTNQNIPGPKPKLFITSSIHAREYTPAELSTRFAEYLIQNYGMDPDVTWILDYHEVHLMLHANPDGRKMAETGLYWRKNVNNNFCADSSSRGVDLNRNFEFGWNCCLGSSPNECSETFRGPSAGSEPEVQAIQQYLRAIFPDQRGPALTDPAPSGATGIYLDLHSYSRLVLWPWGGYSNAPPNGAALQTLGRKFAYFNDYAPEQAIQLYPTDGTTIDFGYGELGVAAYVFELGNTFFESCTYFEDILLPQNLDALLLAAKNARTPYLTPAGPDALDVSLSNGQIKPGTHITLTATLNDTRFNNLQGTEPTQNIAATEYYLDVPPWITTTVPVAIPMLPVDGQFDSPIENAFVSLEPSSLSLGRHTLYVRGQDAGGNWGAISAIFLWIGAQQTLELTASVTNTLPGEIFTYTLTYEAELTGTHLYSLTLHDSLPDEVNVLTHTIRLNGNPAPNLYNPIDHGLHLTQTGTFTGTQGLTLTLQVSTTLVPNGTFIANLFTTALSVDGLLAAHAEAAPAVVQVISPLDNKIYLSLMVR